MDLLYSRYASPFEFMRLYIEQERFGEFVSEIIEMDFERKKEAAERAEDDRLWDAYIHSLSGKTFSEWKENLEIPKSGRLPGGTGPSDNPVTKDEVKAAVQKSQAILKSFVPD